MLPNVAPRPVASMLPTAAAMPYAAESAFSPRTRIFFAGYCWRTCAIESSSSMSPSALPPGESMLNTISVMSEELTANASALRMLEYVVLLPPKNVAQKSGRFVSTPCTPSPAVLPLTVSPCGRPSRDSASAACCARSVSHRVTAARSRKFPCACWSCRSVSWSSNQSIFLDLLFFGVVRNRRERARRRRRRRRRLRRGRRIARGLEPFERHHSRLDLEVFAEQLGDVFAELGSRRLARCAVARDETLLDQLRVTGRLLGEVDAWLDRAAPVRGCPGGEFVEPARVAPGLEQARRDQPAREYFREQPLDVNGLTECIAPLDARRVQIELELVDRGLRCGVVARER